jgi:hypothetical protein
MSGKVIENRTNVNGVQQFNLDRHAFGMYIVQITTGGQTYRTKVSIF